MHLKLCFRTFLLGSALCLLTSCAAWHGDQDPNASLADGSTTYNSAVQTAGLGQPEAQKFASSQRSQGQGLNKRVYYFDFDSSELHEDDIAAVIANADWLSSHPESKILIEGHTDPRGSREYNVGLGERRAKALAAVMKEKGLQPSQVRLISYGSEKLASNGHSDADYQLDRRVVIEYIR